MSKFFSDVTKRNRKLVKVIADGNAKTFVYQDLDEKDNRNGFWVNLFNKLVNKKQTNL